MDLHNPCEICRSWSCYLSWSRLRKSLLDARQKPTKRGTQHWSCLAPALLAWMDSASTSLGFTNYNQTQDLSLIRILEKWTWSWLAATAPTQVVGFHPSEFGRGARHSDLPGYCVYSSTMRRIDFWCACVTSRGDSQSDNSALARCGAQLPAIHARANQHASGGFYIHSGAPGMQITPSVPALYSSIQSVSAPRCLQYWSAAASTLQCRAERRISAYDRHVVASAHSLCQSLCAIHRPLLVELVRQCQDLETRELEVE